MKYSAFSQAGFQKSIGDLRNEIKELYLENDVPWVIGYSGGKDSTATLQLVWTAIKELDPDKRKKPIYVISTDTLVENPVVSSWVDQSLKLMCDEAKNQGLPFLPHRLYPDPKDTFWVKLIGYGYAAPRHKFRWCTDRLKIKPSNKFILDVASSHGEAILVLGTRKAESAAREKTMKKYEKGRVRDRLSPSGSLKNTLVYSPIEDWSNDDVWMFLMQVKNPWGQNNKGLLAMYSGASEDGECPLVVDTGTPSCGASRFGCWVCTMVDKDKSMTAMIKNDEEKEWMLPLLDLRNELDIENDRHMRDYRRMNGKIQTYKGRVIPGPYVKEAREYWLMRLLIVQKQVGVSLITKDELENIRQVWIESFGCDSLSDICKNINGESGCEIAFLDHRKEDLSARNHEENGFLFLSPRWELALSNIPNTQECFCEHKAVILSKKSVDYTAIPCVFTLYKCKSGHITPGKPMPVQMDIDFSIEERYTA